MGKLTYEKSQLKVINATEKEKKSWSTSAEKRRRANKLCDVHSIACTCESTKKKPTIQVRVEMITQLQIVLFYRLPSISSAAHNPTHVCVWIRQFCPHEVITCRSAYTFAMRLLCFGYLLYVMICDLIIYIFIWLLLSRIFHYVRVTCHSPSLLASWLFALFFNIFFTCFLSLRWLDLLASYFCVVVVHISCFWSLKFLSSTYRAARLFRWHLH